MLSLINKYLNPKHPEQAQWFADKTLEVIYKQLRTDLSGIRGIQAFYNHDLQNCILKIEFDQFMIADLGDPVLYLDLDYNTKQMEHYGRNLEQKISDVNGRIAWIQNNKIHIFYPDTETMAVLSKKLDKHG